MGGVPAAWGGRCPAGLEDPPSRGLTPAPVAPVAGWMPRAPRSERSPTLRMRFASLVPQPLMACVLTVLAVAAAWASAAGTGNALLSPPALPGVLVAAGLTAGLLWTYRLPVEFGSHTKIQLT